MYRERVKKSDIKESVRQYSMSRSNPRYVLKNWIAQTVISQTEKGDFTELNQLLNVLQRPFDKHEYGEKKGYAGPSPSWANDLKVSCSS